MDEPRAVRFSIRRFITPEGVSEWFVTDNHRANGDFAAGPFVTRYEAEIQRACFVMENRQR